LFFHYYPPINYLNTKITGIFTKINHIGIFIFAAGCRTLFTVVGFSQVRYIISNLKGFSRAITLRRMKTGTNHGVAEGV
jgi:predicted membrane channel-forming protein YqfA (hemolysin III family)